MDLESAALQGVMTGGSMAAAMVLLLRDRLIAIEGAINSLRLEMGAALRGRPPPPNAAA